MSQDDSKAAAIIDRLLGVIEDLLLETVSQRVALNLLTEHWPNEEKPDWHLLVGPTRTDMAQTAGESVQEIRGRLLEELARDAQMPLQEWEKIVRKLLESVKDVDRPE